jgi:hypothetical protein
MQGKKTRRATASPHLRRSLVVYPNPADNLLSANTWYNALISLPSEGAWPWCRIFFSTSWR